MTGDVNNAMNGWPIEFEAPYLLVLLAAVPLVLLALRFTLVDNPRFQIALSAMTRVCILLLLALALAQALWLRTSRDLAVLVLADVSDSVPEGAAGEAQAFLSELETRAGVSAKAGLLAFADSVESLAPLSEAPEFPDALPELETADETRIEAALTRAREIMPSGAVNRVVLFSDGNETQGDALAAAKRLAGHGVKVFPMGYAADDRPEVLLEDLELPSEVKRGQSFTIRAAAQASAPTTAQFTLYRDGFKIGEQTLDLDEGANTLAFDETNPADGMTQYELRVAAADDYYADNNVASGIVFAAGEPRVLLLEGDERDARHLARALEAENIRVDVREGRGMPGTLAELAAFDAVLMSNVPATDVSVQQMNALRTYIEDLGGGFIMIGGDESFGLGGYYRTAIEDALPVRMQSEKKTETPSLAMMLVVDKSGSMQGEKIQLAKEAGIAAVELLGDRDYVGVVGFDGEPYWVVNLQSAANKLGIVQTIGTLDAGGGTNIYPAMEEAYVALQQVTATFKHCILLTDGQSQPGDFAGIVDQLVSEQVTVSTVAVGEGADTELLTDMARWGKGRYYFTADPFDIPQIFAKETMQASKSSLVEEPFFATVFRQDQVIQSIDWESAPFLFGYVVVTPKPTAEVSLVTERGDPLLAGWRFGLGKSVAFMSDAKSQWAADWLSWPGYGLFWSQLVRDTMRQSSSEGTETAITIADDRGKIVVDAVDEFGQFMNDLTTTAQLIDPALETHDIELAQTAPGRYEADFPAEATGNYLLNVRQAAAGEDGASETIRDFTRGAAISYKAEYRHLATRDAFLEEIAAVTGGAYNASIDDVLALDPGEGAPVRERLWPWLVLAALILFILDVALRRIDLGGLGLRSRPQRYG